VRRRHKPCSSRDLAADRVRRADFADWPVECWVPSAGWAHWSELSRSQVLEAVAISDSNDSEVPVSRWIGGAVDDSTADASSLAQAPRVLATTRSCIRSWPKRCQRVGSSPWSISKTGRGCLRARSTEAPSRSLEPVKNCRSCTSPTLVSSNLPSICSAKSVRDRRRHKDNEDDYRPQGSGDRA
jgi:hypothetical protein